MQAYESFSKLNMDYTIVFVLVFVLIPEIAAWESTLLSSSTTSRNNSRLKGLSFKSFQAESVVSCALRCQRVPRCISLNFRKTLSSEPAQQSMGVCEFNEREAVFKSAALQHEEGYVYIQLHNTNAGVGVQIKQKKIEENTLKHLTAILKVLGIEYGIRKKSDYLKNYVTFIVLIVP